MRLISGKQQKTVDAFLEQKGVPVILLMEAAGRALAAAAEDMLKKPSIIDFFIGPGMNGGDLYVAARILAGRDYHCRIWEMKNAASGGNAVVRQMREAALACVPEVKNFSEYSEAESPGALAADGLLGTGFDPERALSEELQEGFAALKRAKERGAKILACDLPSGITADLGLVHELTQKADACVTFVCPKAGQLESPACQYNGRLYIANLDLPEALLQSCPVFRSGEKSLPEKDFSFEDSAAETLPDEVYGVDEEMFREHLPLVQSDTHKWKQGHALLIAGHKGMAGAARLAGEAAQRSGPGLLTILCDRSVYPELFAALPSALYCLPEDEGEDSLAEAARNKQDKVRAVLAGPGLGVNERTQRLLDELLSWEQPLILDADALTVLSSWEEGAASLRARGAAGLETVLTPHGGEAERLAKAVLSPEELAQWRAYPRASKVKLLAKAYGSAVLLKGEASVLSSADGQRLYINGSGGPVLAKGGSGDILAGLMLGLAAQNIDLETAAFLAMYWHGAAGDRAAKLLSERTALPTDTLAALTAVVSP